MIHKNKIWFTPSFNSFPHSHWTIRQLAVNPEICTPQTCTHLFWIPKVLLTWKDHWSIHKVSIKYSACFLLILVTKCWLNCKNQYNLIISCSMVNNNIWTGSYLPLSWRQISNFNQFNYIFFYFEWTYHWPILKKWCIKDLHSSRLTKYKRMAKPTSNASLPNLLRDHNNYPLNLVNHFSALSCFMLTTHCQWG